MNVLQTFFRLTVQQNSLLDLMFSAADPPWPALSSENQTASVEVFQQGLFSSCHSSSPPSGFPLRRRGIQSQLLRPASKTKTRPRHRRRFNKQKFSYTCRSDWILLCRKSNGKKNSLLVLDWNVACGFHHGRKRSASFTSSVFYRNVVGVQFQLVDYYCLYKMSSSEPKTSKSNVLYFSDLVVASGLDAAEINAAEAVKAAWTLPPAVLRFEQTALQSSADLPSGYKLWSLQPTYKSLIISKGSTSFLVSVWAP